MAKVHFLKRIETLASKGILPKEIAEILRRFFISYAEAVEDCGKDIQVYASLFTEYLEMILEQLKNPYPFELYHQRVLEPHNYYQFGLDLIRPLIQFENSKVTNAHLIDIMCQQLKEGNNVILFANHQTEPDPQAISLLLEKTHPKFAEEMIFVAGHRVISDPLAIPFSMGRNLLCIYSKKHIENPPEYKSEKLQHNQRTMNKMAQLLSEGGKCIYVAPSGGRDRPDTQGVVDVAKFDPQSIELFWLMAQKAQQKTHFYPLALATYDLLPPPNSVEKKLGEQRHAQSTPIHLAFDEEIPMENIPSGARLDRKEARQVRADYIWEIVQRNYAKIRSAKKDQVI